jgi:transcriptional regulator with XRE-family HTH domain
MARHAKKWTALELADRAGVSRRTVLNAEAGSESVSLGNILNIAALAGVELFGFSDPVELARARRRGEERLALIPSKVYPATGGDTDDDYDF